MRLVLSLVLLFLGDAARFYRLGFVQFIDAKLYDYRLRLTLPKTADDRIVILDIDEKSLKEDGRWPWSRDKMATLMDKLFEHYGVAVVGFDVVFAEKDNSSGLKVLQDLGRNQFKGVSQFQSVLNQVKPHLEYDQLFADKIKQRNVVLGYYFSNSERRFRQEHFRRVARTGIHCGNLQGTPDLIYALGQLRRESAGVARQRGTGRALQSGCGF